MANLISSAMLWMLLQPLDHFPRLLPAFLSRNGQPHALQQTSCVPLVPAEAMAGHKAALKIELRFLAGSECGLYCRKLWLHGAIGRLSGLAGAFAD